MSQRPLDDQSVLELQRLAAGAGKRKTSKRAMSRAGRLHLIDILSRWSMSGLATITGISVYLAVTVGALYPGRATAWSALVLAALWTSRSLCAKYRAGDAITARPFRWRANYTSTLFVLGTAFGAAPMLLVPSSAPISAVLPIIGFVLLGALAAGVAHAAHRASAAAVAAPCLVFIFTALARSNVDGLALVGVCALSLLVVGAVIGVNHLLYSDAEKRRPRTGFLRSEVAPARGAAIAQNPAQAALR